MAGLADLIAMLKGGAGTGQDMSMLQSLGMQIPGQSVATGAAQAMPASMLNPAIQSGGGLGDIGSMLSRFGAGMSQASGPSRMPVDFGQALAGGNQAVQAGEDSDIARQLQRAQIEAISQKAQPDLEKQAQAIMMKKQMGIPLSPQEEAVSKSYDAFGTAKMQTITMPDGTIRQVPAQRPVFGTPPIVPSGGQPVRQRPPLSSFVR